MKSTGEGECHTHLVPKDAPDTCLRCSYSRGWTPDVNDAQSKQSARAKAATAVPKKSCMRARTASTYMLKMNRGIYIAGCPSRPDLKQSRITNRIPCKWSQNPRVAQVLRNWTPVKPGPDRGVAVREIVKLEKTTQLFD